ncbi:MAG TPA: hypothetical protein VF258_06525, partial [Luteolibacter sp.]
APAIRRSTLPLEKILARLEATGHQAALSHNPGRYLCNQVFYLAIEWMKNRATPCPAGFIHLPLAQDCPTERAADALGQMIRVINPQVSLGEGGQ